LYRDHIISVKRYRNCRGYFGDGVPRLAIPIILDYSGNTAVIISVACDIPGRVALDLFKLVGVPADPDSGSIFDRRPDV